MLKHKQVQVKWRGWEAEVDEGIAPLILAIWQAGIWTHLSCQENQPGIAWIAFPSTRDAKEFLNRVAVYPEVRENPEAPFREELYDRVAGKWENSGHNWCYDLFPHDNGVDEELLDDDTVKEFKVGPTDFDFSVSVRFPCSDIPLIMSQLQQRVRTEGEFHQAEQIPRPS